MFTTSGFAPRFDARQIYILWDGHVNGLDGVAVAVAEGVSALLIKGNQTFSYGGRERWTSVPGKAIVGASNTVAVKGGA